MEYREYYCGDMTIPEEKRGEFTQRVLTIMDHGGLMATEKVRLCGRELTLLAPPRLDAGNNVCVDFSYFEYAKYDPIHYNADTARMSCGYMDAREFFSAGIAAWVLREFYAESFGLAHHVGIPMPLKRSIGWLNYLFHEQYDARRANDIWKVYQLFPEDVRKKWNYTKLLDEHSGTLGTLKYMVCGEKDVRALDKERYVDLQKRILSMYPVKEAADCLGCIRLLDGAKEETLNTIKAILTTPAPERYAISDGTYYKRFAELSEQLPGEVSVKLVSETFGLEYADLMDEIGDAACAAARPEEKGDGASSPVPAMTTAAFFMADNDDRVYWWRENGDVVFSDAMENWLRELGGEYKSILHTHTLIGMDGETSLRRLVEELHRIENVFGKLYCFHTFFYEYLGNSDDPRYQAAALLLGDLIDRLGGELPQPDRENFITDREKKNSLPLLKMKRYLALLGNRELRHRVLGF